MAESRALEGTPKRGFPKRLASDYLPVGGGPKKGKDLLSSFLRASYRLYSRNWRKAERISPEKG